VHLDIIKVLLPTDAQENCFERSIKIYINTLRTGSFKLFKLFKRPFPGFLTILNL